MALRKLILACVPLAAISLAGCDVDVQDPGAPPTVDVEPGRAPDVDVQGPDVDVRTEERTIDVPNVDVDVTSEERQVEVPNVDINPPADDEREIDN